MLVAHHAHVRLGDLLPREHFRHARIDAPFDDEVFLHDVPPENLLDEEERDETETIFAAPWGLERWPDVPTRVLAGIDDRLFPFTFQQRVARERLGIPVEGVPGGHLPALSRPHELAETLVRGL